MPDIFTVGHSNQSLADLVQLLRAWGVVKLIDIRSYPSSKRYPHFSRQHLELTLPEHGIDYGWLGDLLGGMRREGYPAYMKTHAFEQGLLRLEANAAALPAAILCAERDWRHCHRQYVADALKDRGWSVWHLWDNTTREEHRPLF